jgi:hypothetical protein
MYTRDIKPAPTQLVVNGKPQFGCYNTPVQQANLIDTQGAFLLPGRAIRNFQLREWQAFQMNTDQWFVMAAIYNTKKISLVQWIVYDKQKGTKTRYERKVPGWHLQVPSTLYGSKAGYDRNGFRIEVEHDLGKHALDIEVDIKAQQGLPAVQATLHAMHDPTRFEPMVVCLPFSERRALYSHKCVMPLEGFMQLGEQRIEFLPGKSQLIIDDHKGFYPYVTQYDWVTGIGADAQGTPMGFNLTRNQCIQQEQFNENGLWMDGKLHPLPPLQFERPNGPKGDWLIKDNYGMVDLVFTPKSHTSLRINALVIESRYEGPYGYISGTIKPNGLPSVEIDHMFGMGEDFYLRS